MPDDPDCSNARRGAGDLRRGLPLRVRAPRLPASRRVRARGRARAPRGGRAAAPRVRARRLRRRRGVHLLRPPREAADRRPGAPARAHQPPGARDRREVARETGTLLAGDICNTNVYPATASRARVRGDVRGAGRLGGRRGGRLRHRRDVLVGGRGAGRARGHQGGGPAGGRHAPPHSDPETREGWTSRKRAARSRTPAPTSSASTAPAGRRRCCRCSRRSARPSSVPVAALPVPYRTHDGRADIPVAARPARARPARLPDGLDPFTCTRHEIARLRGGRARAGRRLPRRVLRRGPAPHPGDGRGDRPHAAREPVLARTCPSTPSSAPIRP